MKKLLMKAALGAAALAPMALAVPALAATNWDVTGSYVVEFTCTVGCPSGPYAHDMTLAQDGSDNLTGNGGHPAGGTHVYTWVVTSGSVSGDTLSLSANYTASADAVTPQTTMLMNGTIAPDGTMTGTWSDNYQEGTRGGTWVTTSGNAVADTDESAPVVSDVTATTPVNEGQTTTLTANADDTTTGGSTIVSAEYSVDGGDWTNMSAQDSTFDEVAEDVTASLTDLTFGEHEVCVRATDSAANESDPVCTSVTVNAQVVSGGGSIIGTSGKTAGKKEYTFSVDISVTPSGDPVGKFQFVNHTTKTTCSYDTISNLSISGGVAMFTASGGSCASVNVTVTDNGEPGSADRLTVGSVIADRLISGGNFQVREMPVIDSTSTFSASDSNYYNGPTSSSPLYATGAFSVSWDTDTGVVTGGYYNEVIGSTTYENVISSGTVSGNNFTLNFTRTVPNSYAFAGTLTLSGNTMTGTLDGPYYFTATGTVTP